MRTNNEQKIVRNYEFRLYPTKSQELDLKKQLSECCSLYNAALQNRKEHYEKTGETIKKYDQTYQLKEILGEGLSEIKGFSTAWHVLDRLDKAFSSFFRRIKKGEIPGFPRFKSWKRFNSFDWQVSNSNPLKRVNSKFGKFSIPSLGKFKIRLHRDVKGTIKHGQVKYKAGRWYVVISAEYMADMTGIEPKKESVGLDAGVVSFARLSTGENFENPKFYKNAKKKLRVAARSVARKIKGSNGREKAKILFARASALVANQRKDFHHKLSYKLSSSYGLIAVEDLQISNMTKAARKNEDGIRVGKSQKSGLNKSISDAGWGNFLNMISYKAEEAGGKMVRVNPRGTSQKCSSCNHTDKDNRQTQAKFECVSCGHIANADVNAAINILGAGIVLAEPTWEITPCVSAEFFSKTKNKDNFERSIKDKVKNIIFS